MGGNVSRSPKNKTKQTKPQTKNKVKKDIPDLAIIPGKWALWFPVVDETTSLSESFLKNGAVSDLWWIVPVHLETGAGKEMDPQIR